MDEFIKYSHLTGKKYNIFSCIKIYNLKQSMAYMCNGVYPVDIKFSIDKKMNKPILVFYFVMDETKDVMKLWNEHKLEVNNNEAMWD